MAFSFIRIAFIFCISIAAAACGTTYPTTTTERSGSSTVYNAGQMEADILTFVNQYRAKIGKKALATIDAVSIQADRHSTNMASGRTRFGHDGFDARMEAIRKQVSGIYAAAENVAFGQLSAREVVDGWLKSPGHKKNIEGDYNFTGIGTAKNSKGVIYFTQIFLSK